MPGAGDDGYEYMVGMKDEMSSPARDATAGLDTFTGALRRNDAALKAHGAGAHAAASGISYLVRGFDDLSRGGRYAANGLLDLGKAGARLGPWLAGIGITAGVAAFTKYAFEVSEAKDQTIEAFGAFQGSATKGAETFRIIDDMSASIHVPAEKAQSLAKELLEVGLEDQAALAQTVRAITEMQRVGLDAGAGKIKSIVERSLAAGHFVLGKGGRQLAGTGISETDIAKQLGLPSTKALDAQLKSGKVTVEEGLAAIDHAIIEGKVGALATKKFTVSDAFTDLHNSVRKLFQETDTSPLTEALKDLTQNFADGTDGARQLSEAAEMIVSGIASAVRGVVDFGETMNTVFDAAWDKIDWLGDKWATLGKSEADAKGVLAQRHAQRAAQEMGGAISQQQAAFEKVQRLAKSGASKAEIQKTAERLGIEVDVLAPGKGKPGTREPMAITKEIPGLNVDVDQGTWSRRITKNMYDLGANAGDAFHKGAAGPKGVDAHSPSKKMYELGVDAGSAFPAGAKAAQEMAQNNTTISSSSSSKSVRIDVGGIQVHGSIADADFIPLLESQIADVFERVGLELGQ